MGANIKVTRRTKQVLIDLDKHPKVFESSMRAGLEKAGSIVVRKDVELIKNGPKTGRVYMVKGKKHRASSPGEPPANQSGRLARSAGYKVHRHDKMQVGESADYATFLDSGTKYMAPRHGLLVAVNETAIDVLNCVNDEINKGIKI